jgi:hypothetical protein
VEFSAAISMIIVYNDFSEKASRFYFGSDAHTVAGLGWAKGNTVGNFSSHTGR